MAELRTARISMDAQGMGTVEVDGNDISRTVRGLTLTTEAGHLPRLVLDLLVFTSEADGEAQVHIPADTAATLVALGWTPPDDGQPVDLTDPKRHDQIIKIIKREQRRDPEWFLTLLRREARIQGTPLGVPTERLPRRAIKVDGVLTDGDVDKAREALRQMDADPYGLKAGLVVKPYTDHGERKWVFRCWGTDDGCEGMVSLDHTTRTSAESARDRHLADAHTKAGEDE